MRILIDLQGAQTASRFRGIGRYCLALAQAMVRNKGDHEIFIALNRAFSDTLEPLRHAFEYLLPARCICIWGAPIETYGNDSNERDLKSITSLIRDNFFQSLKPDVILITSFFEGYADHACVGFTHTKTDTLVAVIVYDLIPLVNPTQYLDNQPSYATFYRKQIENLKRSDLFLAISESSRQEAIDQLGIALHQTFNISAACDVHFRPLIQKLEVKHKILEKWGVNKPFILYTGGADERKNLLRLIQAYSNLSQPIRTQHQLVFAGKLVDAEKNQLLDCAITHGLTLGDVCFTGYITDDDLVQAYNQCRLFVFPSWHEGFGLPPLEAMSCGAPVIASRTSSLPEVVGMPEAMFDPMSVEDIRDLMQRALIDEDYRQKLVVHGQNQAQRFSWDQSARQALVHLEKSWTKRQLGKAKDEHLVVAEKSQHQLLVRALAHNLKGWGNCQDEDLSDIASAITDNQLQVAAALLPKRLMWRTEGPFDSSYSLALVNREFALALNTLGHEVALHSTEGPGDFEPSPNYLAANPSIAQLHAKSRKLTQANADIVSRFTYPPRVNDMTASINALHCYGWEESQFPDAWADDFNTHLQCVTVMSDHVAKVMVDNGVSIPVVNVGIGVDHWERIQPQPDFNIKANSFRFLHVSSCFPRKGADIMLRAYGQAFRARDDVTLIIKTFANPHNDIEQWLSQARADDPDYPDVQILNEDFSDECLKALYQECHALIAPSRAEGFGLPLAEAMLSGLAVITTAWSGQLDFCNQNTAWLIDYHFDKAQTHFDLHDSVWAEPDVQKLSSTLLEVYETPPAQRAQRSASGRRLLLERFKWTDVALRAEEAIRQHATHSLWPAPRVGWVTTWNTRCGIASYSSYLTRSMPTTLQLLANHTHDLTAIDDERVTRCWQADGGDDLTGLDEAIETAQLDVVVVQFNYGFFDFQRLSEFLHRQKHARRSVVIEMHATTDPIHLKNKRLRDLVPVLSQCARILVHSVGDLNRLKALGLVNNVTLFPLGLPDYNPLERLNLKRPNFVLASYGFFLPHKGFSELIDAVLKLKKSGIPIMLHMVNAHYPAPESDQAIQDAKAKVQKARANDFIKFTTEYLSDEASLDLLAKADLIVYPYQQTGESASAAVRHGIASGTPIAVTPLDIFNDVQTAVHKLPGITPDQIAQGLSQIIANINNGDPHIKETLVAMEKWRQKHLYSRLAVRMHNMLIGIHRQKSQLPETLPN